MRIPSVSDLSPLLASISIVLLLTSEVLLSSNYFTNLILDRSKLRIAAISSGLAFIVTIIIQLRPS